MIIKLLKKSFFRQTKITKMQIHAQIDPLFVFSLPAMRTGRIQQGGHRHRISNLHANLAPCQGHRSVCLLTISRHSWPNDSSFNACQTDIEESLSAHYMLEEIGAHSYLWYSIGSRVSVAQSRVITFPLQVWGHFCNIIQNQPDRRHIFQTIVHQLIMFIYQWFIWYNFFFIGEREFELCLWVSTSVLLSSNWNAK